MVSKFEQLLDEMILLKNKKGITIGEISENTKLSKPCIGGILNYNLRGQASLKNILKVAECLDKLAKEDK